MGHKALFIYSCSSVNKPVTRPIKQVIQGSIPYQYVVGAPVQATAVLICAPSVDGTKRTNEHGVARGRESAEYG